MVFSPYKSELTPGGDFQMKAVGNLDEMVQGSYLSFSIDRAHILLDNPSWGRAWILPVLEVWTTTLMWKMEGRVAPTEDILWTSGSGKQNLVE